MAKEIASDKVVRRTANATVWMAAFTIVLALVSTGTLWILRKQLQEMHDGGIDTHSLATASTRQAAWSQSLAQSANLSANAAKSAAETAASTLNNQQQIFEIDQRPYLVTEAPQFIINPVIEAGEDIYANVTFKNIGRTPARKCLLNDDLLKYNGKNRTQFMQFIHAAFKTMQQKNAHARGEISRYGDEEDIAPNGTTFTTNRTPIVIPIPEIPDLEAGKIAIFNVGIVTYTDSFNRPYKTSFCYFYFGKNPQTWHICPSNNAIR